jgi:hypothetical protein
MNDKPMKDLDEYSSFVFTLILWARAALSFHIHWVIIVHPIPSYLFGITYKGHLRVISTNI